MGRFALILTLLLLAGCRKDSAEEYGAEDFAGEAAANITIAEVQEFYRYGGTTTFRRDYTVTGIVTANDRSGNFHRTFIIEDATGAVEIMSGIYDLYPLYPEGRRVYVRLTGLTLGCYEGTYRLGLKGAPGSGFEVDYLAATPLVDRYVIRGGMEEAVPREMSIDAITDGDAGRLVKVAGLTLENGGSATWAVAAEDSWNGSPGAKDVKAWDADSLQISVYTSGYASFALDTIPAGEVAVTGIVMKNGSRYRLKMRDLTDVEVY